MGMTIKHDRKWALNFSKALLSLTPPYVYFLHLCVINFYDHQYSK